MTVKEFFDSNEKLAIHCDIEDKALELLKAFDTAGYKWHRGNRYIEDTYWYSFEEETCYTNNRYYTDIEWCQEKGYRILEFVDIDF